MARTLLRLAVDLLKVLLVLSTTLPVLLMYRELSGSLLVGLMASLGMMVLAGLGLLPRVKLKSIRVMVLLTFKRRSKGEDWATTLGCFIPRKYRCVIGDILEDCAEMRAGGCTESRIKLHVVYQWLIAVITLVPMAVKTSITEILKQVISPLK